MKIEYYLENMEIKLSKYFDIEKSYNYINTEYQLFAKSFIRSEKYIASKKLTIYAIENNEFIFVKTFTELEEKELLQFTDHLMRAAEDYVDPHSEHMSTVITGIIVVEKGSGKDLRKMIEKFKFMRSFAFGFKGWVYIRLLVVDLDKGEVICNRRGREVKKFYQMND
ncbi:hypothetical protein SAMN05446037_103624 [Anaerovirgula multivorans]|uniref:DUF8052 domain-containing protein n=1 Tax=Anaerovirgula multivorans TaxID=312168 RepID=A0A239JJD8_9FIRM|nr:hypothetical protein [Anaerovirgula multivorans]SNT05945.1 hypothetical protein SAMN05446037_103624 [Anaerovirgula multivorans]